MTTTGTTSTVRRIDSLTVGSRVQLRFVGRRSFGNGVIEEDAVFLGIAESGDKRRAMFKSFPFELTDDGAYEWEAYRYNGGWAYGTSADRLQLARVYA